MVLVGAVGSESRFAAYVEGLATVIGHKDRVGPLRDYCTGLMLPSNARAAGGVRTPKRTSSISAGRGVRRCANAAGI